MADTKTKTKTPTTAPGGLDYAKCKRAELDVFYKQRLHKDVPKGVNKPELIQMLRRADQDPRRFRFLDLPAEMRNAVYKEVLMVPPAGARRRSGNFQPVILRASRQIHAEAHGILYGENELEVIMGVTDHSSPHRKILERHCSIPLFSKLTRKDYFRYGHKFALWSRTTRSFRRESLSRFHNMSVKVDISERQNSKVRSANASQLLTAVNQMLYSLCDFLAPSLQKRSITFKLNAQTSHMPSRHLYAILWPVTRLGPGNTIHFTGVPQDVQNLLRSARVGENASTSLLESIAQAQPRVAAISEAVAKLGIEKRRTAQGEVDTWYATCKSVVLAFGSTMIMNPATEGDMRRSISNFQQVPAGKLADLLATNIGEKIRALEKLKADVEHKRGFT